MLSGIMFYSENLLNNPLHWPILNDENLLIKNLIN
jgi:hypothetical protein